MTVNRSQTLLLLRHGSADPKDSHHVCDQLRGLDRSGLRQAELLVPSLALRNPPAILTSAARRCVETVEPLARALGLEVEGRCELLVGTTKDELRRLLSSCRSGTVLCTHREVIELLVGGGNAPQKAGGLLVEVGRAGEMTFELLPPPQEHSPVSAREPVPSLAVLRR